MTDFLSQWAILTWQVLTTASPWLIAGFLMAGAIHVLLPTDKVTRHLGKPGLGAVIKASLIGVPLPLCSCGVIPVATALRKQGASRGATASFLISTPETGVDSISVSYVMLGPFLAVIRPIAAFITAFITGALVSFLDRIDQPASEISPPPQEKNRDNPSESCCCHAATIVVPQKKTGFVARVFDAVRYGLVDMFADLSHWLAIGFVLAGLIAAVIPAGFIEQYVGTGWSPKLLMVMIGLPLYVCATSSTPIAAALMAKGLSPGAAVVFLLVGPATNIATMVVVSQMLGYRALAIYLTCIVVVALGLGFAVDALPTAWMGSGLVLKHVHSMGFGGGGLAALVLLVLIGNGIRVHFFSDRSKNAHSSHQG